ncbi:hypothetical protein V1525DRAFT_384640 [Lipomyces kononenkoae]|uniref:Uncharacterized protein n=1 Tax=Lipomyces kononenkoae TaxID=34357 RepID=A0ACC3TBF4_LIPKO
MGTREERRLFISILVRKLTISWAKDIAAEKINESDINSFTIAIVEDGEYVGHNTSLYLRELVFEDYIPNHLLQVQEIIATPMNSSRQEWFEDEFQASMVLTAAERVHKLF